MKQPHQATFVKIAEPSNKIHELEQKAQQINANIDKKVKKFNLPQGPAWINGRWW